MIRHLLLVILLCHVCGPVLPVQAQSPLRGPASEQRPAAPNERIHQPADWLPQPIRAWGQKAMGRIILWQAQIRQQAGAYARQIQENPYGPALGWFLGLAFVYGVIHALGPGHGKVYAGTWFLTRPARVSHAFLMGGLMSLLHVLAAVVLVLLFYGLFKASGLGSVDTAGRHLQRISAGLISLVGLFMVWKAGRALLLGTSPDSSSSGLSGSSGSYGTDAAPGNRTGLLPLSLAVGLVPCPGAALILFFAITLDILWAGLLAMLFLAAGLAVTTISVALLALLTRNLLAQVTSRTSLVRSRFVHLPALAGGLLITLLGIILFVNPVV